jgi:predicted negative regulator of RcsB-dependent stress response
MSAQSVAGQSRRPSKPESDDALVLRAIEFSAWAKRNIRLIVAAAVVVVVLVGGLLYWRMYREDRMERAAAEFVQLQQTAASGNVQLAARDMEQYVRRFEGTVYAEEARIALAQLHLQQDSAGRAVEVLAGAADRVGDSPLGPQAALLLAAAQQANGDPDAAIASYMEVADEAELSFRQIAALEAAAQLHARQGNHAEAVAVYQRLSGMAAEGSPERQLYEMRLAEARAQADAGS